MTAPREWAPVVGCGFVPWAIYYEAWQAYDLEWKSGQTAERLAQRGGFHPSEMDGFRPDWREFLRPHDPEKDQYLP